MRRIKVGVIGLGQVAQIVHLPILRAMPDRFEISALCDISDGLLMAVGAEYGVERRYTNAADLVAQELDAVFVLNSDEYHAEHTILAARSGKHVLVEKPMCLTLREAEAIIAARDLGGVQVMVAYMRRYAPAFVEAVELVRQLDKINYARVRDIIGPNALIIEQSSSVHRVDDIPEAAKLDRAERARALVIEAIGEVPADLVTAYRLLLGLGSHDLSAMRELIGAPRSVMAATHWNGGRFMTAIFGYEGFNTTFEMGIDQQRRFDAHLEVYGAERQIRVQYDTPFIRHLPTTLHVRETVGDAFIETVRRPTYTDPYTRELEVFHGVATGRATPKTSPEDFTEDLRLFAQIIDMLKHSRAAGEEMPTSAAPVR